MLNSIPNVALDPQQMVPVSAVFSCPPANEGNKAVRVTVDFNLTDANGQINVDLSQRGITQCCSIYVDNSGFGSGPNGTENSAPIGPGQPTPSPYQSNPFMLYFPNTGQMIYIQAKTQGYYDVIAGNGAPKVIVDCTGTGYNATQLKLSATVIFFLNFPMPPYIWPADCTGFTNLGGS